MQIEGSYTKSEARNFAMELVEIAEKLTTRAELMAG